MGVNAELLDTVLERIKTNLDRWDQGSWAALHINGYTADELKRFVAEDPDNPACGSAMCFAGHTVSQTVPT